MRRLSGSLLYSLKLLVKIIAYRLTKTNVPKFEQKIGFFTRTALIGDLAGSKNYRSIIGIVESALVVQPVAILITGRTSRTA